MFVIRELIINIDTLLLLSICKALFRFHKFSPHILFLFLDPAQESMLHFFKFLYLAASGLNCSTQGLVCVMWDLALWCTNSLVVAYRLSLWHAGLVALLPLGSQFPDQETMSPALQGKHWTTGPPGKSLHCIKKKVMTRNTPSVTIFQVPCFSYLWEFWGIPVQHFKQCPHVWDAMMFSHDYAKVMGFRVE